MKQLRQEIKHNAKWALNKNWGKAIAIVLLGVAISLLFGIFETIVTIAFNLPSFIDVANTMQNFMDDIPNTAYLSILITLALTILSFFVMAPLEMGIKRWFYKISGGASDDISSIFYFFDSARLLLKALWLNICIFFKMFFYSVIFFSLNIVLTVAIALFTSNNPTEIEVVIASVGILLNVLIFICAIIFISIFSFRYFLAHYFIIEDNTLSISKAISLSVKATKGYKQDLFVFKLSMMGWYMLSLFMFPLLYVFPYTRTSFAIYARYIISRKNSSDKAEFTKEFSSGINQEIIDVEPSEKQ